MAAIVGRGLNRASAATITLDAWGRCLSRALAFGADLSRAICPRVAHVFRFVLAQPSVGVIFNQASERIHPGGFFVQAFNVTKAFAASA
jgi:hypothetical protein